MATQISSVQPPSQSSQFAESSPLLTEPPTPPVGALLKDVIEHTKELLEHTMDLARLEAKDAATRAGKHLGHIVIFGLVAAMGVFPLLAFAVIGLGRLLSDNYWLSSLMVAAVLLGTGIPLTLFHLKKLKSENIDLFRTRESLKQNAEIFKSSAEDIKDTLQESKDTITGHQTH